MRIDECRQRQQPLAFDDLGALWERAAPGLGQLGDLAAADDHVANLVDPRARVEHPGAADH